MDRAEALSLAREFGKAIGGEFAVTELRLYERGVMVMGTGPYEITCQA